MPQFETFVKACQEYFSPPKIEVSEFRELSVDDRVEISTLLNAAGYTHPAYTPKVAA